MLERLHSTLCIRVCSAYRTKSGATAGVITGVPPIEVMVEERLERFNGKTKTAAAEDIYKKWQTKWTQSTCGRWTHRLSID
ncbi:hypothetical protein QE152_g32158 [Popillia japonica]|uniref:Uncharacterized protein n=1 Tax=Popillia japonica TaxID=7064 RepID=A0AAW1J027_POPJA